jgi:hypothetical protein
VSTIIIFLTLFSLKSFSHEIRPGYLEIKNRDNKNYHVTWKVPMRGDGVFSIRPIFPKKCREMITPVLERVPGALIEKKQLNCGHNGLTGEKIYIKNLSHTLTDVLVRVETSKSIQNYILRPQKAYFVIQGEQTLLAKSWSFISIGLKHILIGVDHLLFILGLMLIVRGKLALFNTITAFTIAHSLTLGLSTLKLVNIALSIFFLGGEIVRTWRNQTSLMIRHPWVISFLFGLLHGFGFATGLSLTGIPKMEIPFALLSFNIGVELGQIFFILTTLLIARGLSRLSMPTWWKKIPGYIVGSAGAFWFIHRFLGII